MGYSKDGSIEIDVSLNMDQIDRDFDQLVKTAKASVKSVVKVSADVATAMEETGTGARQAGQEIEKASKGMETSLEKAEESAAGLKKETQGLGEEAEKTSREQEDLGDQTEKTRQNSRQIQRILFTLGRCGEGICKRCGDSGRHTLCSYGRRGRSGSKLWYRVPESFQSYPVIDRSYQRRDGKLKKCDV